MKHTCIIVDDEPLAQEVLEVYLNKLENLTLVGKCSNANQAQDILNSQKVDIVFLDINMPRLSGLDFLRKLPNPPSVIFTTAHAEHALEGFELNATDYLLKPISFDRFSKAVSKAVHIIELEQQDEQTPPTRKMTTCL